MSVSSTEVSTSISRTSVFHLSQGLFVNYIFDFLEIIIYQIPIPVSIASLISSERYALEKNATTQSTTNKKVFLIIEYYANFQLRVGEEMKYTPEVNSLMSNDERIFTGVSCITPLPLHHKP